MLPLILLVLIGFYGYYTYAYSMGGSFNLNLKYKFIEINKSQTVKVPLKSGTSKDNISLVNLTAEGTSTEFMEPTGEKITGEKASGQINISNLTNSIKEFPSGTQAVCVSSGCSGLIYTLTQNINIGPVSTESVNVIAADIGSEYNLTSGQGKFQIGDYDPDKEILSQNIKAIAGGTKKEILKVVSKEDLENLEKKAEEKMDGILLNKLKNDVKNKDFIIAESTLKVTKIESTPDHKEGEEAQLLNLTLKSRGEVSGFSLAQIEDSINKLKSESTPAGYYLDEDVTKTSKKIIKETENEVEIQINLTSIARINLDIDKLKSDLAGKNYKDVDKIVSAIPNLTGFTKNYSPQTLPEYFWDIPKNHSRIRITLTTE